MSAPTQPVAKIFQPPLSIGSFDARRVTSVPQSTACRSTLSPSFFRTIGDDQRLRVRDRLIDPIHHDNRLAFVTGLGNQLLCLVEITFPAQAAEPASLAIGVPQVKNEGQTRPIFFVAGKCCQIIGLVGHRQDRLSHLRVVERRQQVVEAQA